MCHAVTIGNVLAHRTYVYQGSKFKKRWNSFLLVPKGFEIVASSNFLVASLLVHTQLQYCPKLLTPLPCIFRVNTLWLSLGNARSGCINFLPR